MLSKNNFNERLRKMEPRKERYSIHKFSVGAASVLIGFFLMGMNQTQTVKAATPSTETSVKAPAAPAEKGSEAASVSANTNNDKQTTGPDANDGVDVSVKNGKAEAGHAGITASENAKAAQSNATATPKDSKGVAERFSNGRKSGGKISTDRAAIAKTTLAVSKKSDAGAAGKKVAAKDSKTAKPVKTEKAAKIADNYDPQGKNIKTTIGNVPAASALDENGVPTDGTTVYVTYQSNGGGDVTPPTPSQGQVIIKYVKKGTNGPVIKTVTLGDNEGSTIPVEAVIRGDVPAGWLLDPDYTVPKDSLVSNIITVPVIADNGGNNPGNDDHHNTNPGNNGNHNNPGNNNNNGNNGNHGNNGAANGNHNGVINGNGGRGAMNNGNGTANGNQARKAALPQTGFNKTSELGLIGLAIASIGSLLGLGVNKKRRN